MLLRAPRELSATSVAADASGAASVVSTARDGQKKIGLGAAEDERKSYKDSCSYRQKRTIWSLHQQSQSYRFWLATLIIMARLSKANQLFKKGTFTSVLFFWGIVCPCRLCFQADGLLAQTAPKQSGLGRRNPKKRLPKICFMQLIAI